MVADLRYPIGDWAGPPHPAAYTPALRASFIDEIAAAPARLAAAVEGLSRAQLETPYRDGGWTVAQVVHHVPDSHINSYTRFKRALTEDAPAVSDYDEVAWAELPDARDAAAVASSLALLAALHERWTALARSLAEADFARSFHHPTRGVVTLNTTLSIYAWHGRHHAAHVTSLRERMGWR